MEGAARTHHPAKLAGEVQSLVRGSGLILFSGVPKLQSFRQYRVTDKCASSCVCYTLQAHHNAQTHSDEFVKSALVSLDKFSVLVRELVTFEVCSLFAYQVHTS